MRDDLVEIIRGAKDVTNAFILTHNIDFPFLQSIALPAFRKCGHPNLTIFADGHCALDSYQRHGQWVEGLGKRYRLVPVEMNPGYRFHPKAILLISESKGLLLIGSGNLTFGGWRENGEIWVLLDSEIDGTASFFAFRDYLNEVLTRVPLNEPIIREVERAFNPSTKPWITETSEPPQIIGKTGSGEPLFRRMLEIVGEDDVRKLTIATPFFDQRGLMLRELAEESNAREVEVLIQDGRSGLSIRAADSQPENVRLRSVNYLHSEDRTGYLHAKFYAFEREGIVTVFSGSANCSNAALHIPGSGGNAELMFFKHLTTEEYLDAYLHELEVLEIVPTLQKNALDTEDDVQTLSIRILAARYTPGQLLIGYTCGAGMKLTKCLVDENEVTWDYAHDNVLIVHQVNPPHQVQIIGISGDETIESALFWIDHEDQLRYSPKQRAIVETIREKVDSSTWTIGAWNELMSLFHQYLEESPSTNAMWLDRPKDEKQKVEPIHYTEADVFADHYGLPAIRDTYYLLTREDRITSLQQLLLRIFGAGWISSELAKPEDEVSDDESIVDETSDSEENKREKKSREKKLTADQKERDRLQARRITEKVVKTLANPAFIGTRSIAQLRIDLLIISLLLKAGRAEDWLPYEDFLNHTHHIWSFLFFNCGFEDSPGDQNAGWIQYCLERSGNQEQFIQQFHDIQLSASLAAWMLVPSKSNATPEENLFELTCAKAFARLPWMWNAHPVDELGAAIQEDLIHTGILDPDNSVAWDNYRNRWNEIIRRGFALNKLELVLSLYGLTELGDMVKRDQLHRGELLWQGNAGLCILNNDYRRSGDGNAVVYCLQLHQKEKKYALSYLLPVKDLLGSISRNKDALLSKKESAILQGFLTELQEGFALSEL